MGGGITRMQSRALSVVEPRQELSGLCLLTLLAMLLSGCVPFDNSARLDAEHKERLRDIELERLKEINSELIKANRLSMKAIEHILLRLQEVEDKRDLPLIRPDNPFTEI